MRFGKNDNVNYKKPADDPPATTPSTPTSPPTLTPSTPTTSAQTPTPTATATQTTNNRVVRVIKPRRYQSEIYLFGATV